MPTGAGQAALVKDRVGGCQPGRRAGLRGPEWQEHTLSQTPLPLSFSQVLLAPHGSSSDFPRQGETEFESEIF